MKLIQTLSLVVLLSGFAVGQMFPPPQTQWERYLAASAWSLKRLSNDGVIVGGYALTNGIDFYLARLDPAGNALWERLYGGHDYDNAYDVEAISDGGFILAGLSRSGAGGDKSTPNYGGSDYWIVRVDSQGNKLWDASFGGSLNDLPRAVLQRSDGSVLVGGESFSPADGNKTSPNLGSWDAWLVCVATNGGKLWETSLGGTNYDSVYALTHTLDGKHVLAGVSEGPSSGNKVSDGFGNWDLWVACVDANATKLWDRSFGGNDHDYAQDVQLTADGGFIVAGYSFSGISGNKTTPHFGRGDGWAVRLDSTGNKLWDRSFGTTNYESFHAAAVTPDGGFIFSGETQADFWIVRTDASGIKLWERTFSAPDIDRAHGVVALPSGGYIVSGILGVDGAEQTRLLRLLSDSPILRQPQFSDTSFSFFLNGTANDYAVEFSTNLSSWTALGTNRLPVTGSEVPVIYPTATAMDRRFYRARHVP
ncbi:MAG TPA: hypothetical protein VJW76_11705 [Verrucomicrobiae bacterium]|nr:hypothetical protein [Verrucomicrobiae bacterium]